MDEIWRDIVGYEGSYEVSSYGRVRSLDRVVFRLGRPKRIKGRSLTLWPDAGTYPTVTLCESGQRQAINVHRLVAEAFLEADIARTHVNHIDGNKANNRADNLEWCTRSENMAHAMQMGLSDKRKPIIGTPKSGGAAIEFASLSDAARHFGDGSSNICNAMRKGCASRGYTWAFKEAA
ncbi:MAG: NUMOD4 motif-containing HNH endonuclease [Novosphingobium sp.]|nr:NUMOD4 motif-containing HNH endonuclease [Novosphingobium sp.]